jgi:uracil-DNA glycosylase family 4
MIDDRHKIFVPGRGSVSSKIVAVGEAPAQREIEEGKCFVGPSGHLLDEMLETAGIDKNEVYFTNAIKYMLGPSEDQYGRKYSPQQRCDYIGQDWSEQVEFLGNEIAALDPNIIIALGGTALQALCNKPFNSIRKWRGSVILGMGHKVIPTFHPAGLFHKKDSEENKYWIKNIIEFDLARALKQSQFREFRYPERLLQICSSSHDLTRFLDDHNSEEYLSIDIEAIKCVPVCIGLAFTSWRGMSVPLWGKTDVCKISDMTEAELVNIWMILDKLLRDEKFKKVGQNFKYDQDKIRRLGFKVNNFYADTLLMSSCVNPEFPKSLEFNTSIYTEEPYYKDEGDEFNYSKHPISNLFYYNSRDSCVTEEVRLGLENDLSELGLTEFYHDFYHYSHDLFLEIENYGIATDEAARAELLLKYTTWELRLKSDLYKLTGVVVNPNSPQQVAKLLYEVFRLPLRKGTGEEVLTAILANTAKKPEHIHALNIILEARRVRKQKGTYILARPDYDGRMRTSYFICGAETGRRSTQMLKPPVRPEKCGVSWHTLSKHGDIGSDIRKMYIPDSGLIFLNLDQSQAEARIVALLCNDLELLSQFDKIDVHALMASYIFGGTWLDHSKQKHGHETPERFIGKTGKHMTNYDAGKHRVMETINTDARKYGIPINISEWKAGKILETLHDKNPRIRQVFHTKIQAIAGKRILTNPFGRKRIFYERYGDDLFKEMYAHIPQSTVADNTLRAMLDVKKEFREHVMICGESHDAFLCQVDKQEIDDLAPRIKSVVEKEIDFSQCSLSRGKLLIPWDLEIGENYKDLSKLKMEVAA